MFHVSFARPSLPGWGGGTSLPGWRGQNLNTQKLTAGLSRERFIHAVICTRGMDDAVVAQHIALAQLSFKAKGWTLKVYVFLGIR